MARDNYTRALMAHIRINGFEANYEASEIIDQRVSKRITHLTSDEDMYIIMADVIQNYKNELKRKEYKNDFEDLLK